MPRIAVSIGWLLLLTAPPRAAIAQTSANGAAQSGNEHTQQLRTCREGIVDSRARLEDRRRWAELLLSYSSPQAKALAAELLAMSAQPDVQRAVCGVIADRARENPERMDVGFVDPMLDLLGASADDLRALAARALSEMPGGDVPVKLAAIAGKKDAPLPKRLAAVDALAPNTHRRDVVGQVMKLLDPAAPEITERAIASLEPLTPITFGADIAAWQSWWRPKSKMTEENWLAEQLQIHRDRLRRREAELGECRGDAKRKEDALTSRIRDFQRELFRLSGDQREAKLIEWLNDPLLVVKRTALVMIRARIADEGKRPEGELLAGLLGLLKHGTPEAKQEVIEIVKNLNDPQVVESILVQVESESDLATRVALFKALGSLGSPDAIPALLQEISDSKAPPECVTEAALSLGRVAPKSTSVVFRQEAIETLRCCYPNIPADRPALKAAMLYAMAGVAARAFTAEFVSAVESDDKAILREAVRGLRASDDASKLPRLRALVAHHDPLVRIAAIEAVGRLGREEADIESLLTRLSPAIETNDSARDAAWRAFRELMNARPLRERVQAAQRLRDVPDLEITYLSELARNAPSAASNGTAADVETLLERLSGLLTAQGRFAEAVPHLRALYESRTARAEPAAAETALRLLGARLRASEPSAVSELLRQLGKTADDAQKQRIVDAVAAYCDSEEVKADPARSRQLLAEFRGLPADLLGSTWPPLLERLATRLDLLGGGPSAPAGSPNPGP